MTKLTTIYQQENYIFFNCYIKQKSNEGRDDKVGPTQAGFLAVWRRVPRRHLVTYSFDPAGNEVTFNQNPSSNINSINLSR